MDEYRQHYEEAKTDGSEWWFSMIGAEHASNMVFSSYPRSTHLPSIMQNLGVLLSPVTFERFFLIGRPALESAMANITIDAKNRPFS
jgi:hypothetical protein